WIDRRADGTVQIDVGRWHVEMRSGPVWSARRPRLHGSGRLSLVDVTHSLALGSRPVKSDGRGWPAVRHARQREEPAGPGGPWSGFGAAAGGRYARSVLMTRGGRRHRPPGLPCRGPAARAAAGPARRPACGPSRENLTSAGAGKTLSIFAGKTTS